MAGGQTRARFLGASAATIGGAALAGAWRVTSADAASAAAAEKLVDGTVTEGAFDARFYGETFSFELDGAAAGKFADVTGGNAVADIVVEKIGSDHIAKKHIANVKYEDLAVVCGTGMSKGFYNWIKDSFDRKYTPHNGAVIGYDVAKQATGRGEFTNALISEVGFPALDAASKDAAKMTIKFRPESTRFAGAQGKASAGGGGVPDISAANFKVEIEGLATENVLGVQAYPVKWEGPDFDAIQSFVVEPSKIEFPNLVFYLPEIDAQPFVDFFDDFVIKGNNADDKERSGALTYMDKKRTPLFTLSFSHLGIFKLTPEKVEAGGESIRRVKAELYCEDVRFSYSPAATFG